MLPVVVALLARDRRDALEPLGREAAEQIHVGERLLNVGHARAESTRSRKRAGSYAIEAARRIVYRVASQRSASIAAMQPVPAAVTAWR